VIFKKPTTLQSELIRPVRKRSVVNRRAFLRGAGTVAIGLPFLEGLPARSAWAAGDEPIFSLFIVAACGVVGNKFFPGQTGALTVSGLSGATDKATSKLGPYADNLLFVKNVNFPMGGATNCGHAQGLCQALTGAPAGGGGKTAYSNAASIDVIVADIVNEGGAEPLTLYAGNRQNGYIAERISFKAGGTGQTRPADDNPYTLYAKLVGLLGSDPGGDPTTDPIAAELLASRKSVNDLVRDELKALMGNSALSADDKLRLQQHFDAIRDVEVTMGEMGGVCAEGTINKTAIEALEGGLAFKMDGMIEDVAKLHMELVALAFACNHNRVATLQHGDGTDQTKYNVPSNSSLGWGFHFISHRMQSDSQSGNNPTAEAAHAEIDVIRMETLAHGIEQFKSRGLLDKSFIMWTNHIADGPSHSFRNVPVIIAGNGGGYLKQGQFVDAGNVSNNKLLNTMAAAGMQDKQAWTGNIGQGDAGELDAIKA
jgi:hypothetical protein